MVWRNSNYKPIRIIGRGAISKVWLAEDLSNNSPVTVKVVKVQQFFPQRIRQCLWNERLCLEKLKTELTGGCSQAQLYHFDNTYLRVPLIVDVFQENLNDKSPDHFLVCLVYQYIDGMTLNEWVNKNDFSEAEIKDIARQLINLLGALHERGLIYRDLKASNVIINKNKQITLIDFGFTKFIGRQGQTSSMCGTFHAMSPEIYLCESFKRDKSMVDLAELSASMEQKNSSLALEASKIHTSVSVSQLQSMGRRVTAYGMEVDWWSLGVLLYEMAYKAAPFGYVDEKRYLDKAFQMALSNSPESLEFPETVPVSDSLKCLIKSLLQADPTHRLGYKADALEVLQFDWFKVNPSKAKSSDMAEKWRDLFSRL